MLTPARAVLSLCVAVGIFVAGYMANRHQAPAASSGTARQVLYYTCPMHPHYKSDHPGDAPCCGMRLVPVYADGSAGQPDPAASGGPGMVQVSAARQQLMGVRTDVVQRAPASHLLRVPGRVAVDEGRLYRLIAAADGWIRELGQNPAGSFVEKDQILASYYTSNLLAASQTLLYGMATNEQAGEGYIGTQRVPTALSLQIAVDSLRSLGMSERQIEELKRTRQATSQIHVYSPIAGFVLARNISPAQRFDKGTEMYRIADIRHVWVLTDIFEKDREFVKPGARATVRYERRQYAARMSDALPQLDPQTRTLKTRFELDNPGYILRPDLFVDVEVQVNMPAALTVPADAIIDSGRRKTVFVGRGSGLFEPRVVETGWRLGDRVQVTGGLEAGERIVISGNFLIDSESQMRVGAGHARPLPAAANTAAEKDPICGMDVDPKAPNVIKAQHGGKTYYFCSEYCKKTFQANPEKYAPKPRPARESQGRPA